MLACTRDASADFYFWIQKNGDEHAYDLVWTTSLYFRLKICSKVSVIGHLKFVNSQNLHSCRSRSSILCFAVSHLQPIEASSQFNRGFAECASVLYAIILRRTPSLPTPEEQQLPNQCDGLGSRNFKGKISGLIRTAPNSIFRWKVMTTSPNGLLRLVFLYLWNLITRIS